MPQTTLVPDVLLICILHIQTRRVELQKEELQLLIDRPMKSSYFVEAMRFWNEGGASKKRLLIDELDSFQDEQPG